MAQRKNKEKKTEGIDVVNPSEMNEKELDELDAKAREEQDHLNAQLKHVYKGIRGRLWLWWILPIFGWIVYAMVWQNRMQKEENLTKTIILKRAIAEKEIQLMLDKKRRDEINGTSEDKDK